MRRIIVGWLIVGVALIGLATSSFAMRCGPGGKNLALKGDHKVKVLQNCGEPESKEDMTSVNSRGTRYRSGEQWVYIINDYGSKKVYLLRFDSDGILKRIEYLGTQ